MDIRVLLDKYLHIYNTNDFISKDPISIPHKYSKKQDIEISAFLSSTLAWGRRDIILKKCNQLLSLMNNAPHDFVLNYKDKDLIKFEDFKHRTFNYNDLVYFLNFLKSYYRNNESLEEAFASVINPDHDNIEQGLNFFYKLFFSFPNNTNRVIRHISNPAKNSACKRLNMFLRWMVRKDNNGIDFGLWTKIKPNQLVIPCDVHVYNISKKLGLTSRNSVDWKTAIEITKKLKHIDPTDPVKYDFALFSIGVDKLL